MVEPILTRREIVAAVGTSALCSVAGCSVPGTDSIDMTAATQFRSGLQNRGFIDQSIPTAVEADWSVPPTEVTILHQRGVQSKHQAE